MGRPSDLPAAALLPRRGGKCRIAEPSNLPDACDAKTQAGGSIERDNPSMNGDLAPRRPAPHAIASLQLQDTAGEAAAIACLLPFLLSAAIWNGFPVVFYDTGAYLLEGLGGHFLVERSAVYSLFLRVAGARTSLWLVVLTQAAASAFVIVQTARCLVPSLSLYRFLIMAAGLVALTGIGWYVGEIEPDCFAAVLVLALFLLTFRSAELGCLRQVITIGIAGLAVAAHPSHLVLAILLLLPLAAYRAGVALARTKTVAATGLPKASLLQPAAAIAFALTLVVAGNYSFTRQIFLSRAGANFLFARLLQDGVVMRLLEDTCPRAGYRLCAYKDNLPPTATAWLWAPYSPFFKLGGFAGTREESTQIVMDSLRRYPLLNVKLALFDGARQFVSFETGDQVEPQQWALRSVFAALTPRQLQAYLAARQQRGQLHFAMLNRVHVPVGFVSLLGLAGMISYAAWRRETNATIFLTFILAALAGNALICGAISTPHDRYQSRLIWLAPFALFLVGVRFCQAVSIPGASSANRSTAELAAGTETSELIA
jgi:hypothetical protein